MYVYVVICKSHQGTYMHGFGFKSYQEAYEEVRSFNKNNNITYDNYGFYDKDKRVHYNIERVWVKEGE